MKTFTCDETGKKYEFKSSCTDPKTFGHLRPIEEPKKKTIYDLTGADNYFYIRKGLIIEDKYDMEACISTGDAYVTQQEAEQELEKRKALATIKKYINDNDMTFEPDWSNCEQEKWIIGDYSSSYKFFSYTCSTHSQRISPIGCFSSDEHVKKLIKECEKELRILL